MPRLIRRPWQLLGHARNSQPCNYNADSGMYSTNSVAYDAGRPETLQYIYRHSYAHNILCTIHSVLRSVSVVSREQVYICSYVHLCINCSCA